MMKWISAGIFAIAAIYLTAAFMAWSFHPKEWWEPGRLIVAFVWLSIIAIVMINILEENPTQK